MSFDLRLGSCLDAATGLAAMAAQSIDVTIMDPPYEAEAHTKMRRAMAGLKGEDREVTAADLPFPAITEAERMAVAAEVARVTSRWILVFCQVEGAPKWARALEAAGAQYVRTMVWVKPDGQPQLTGDRPGMGYESIVVAHRKGRKRWNGGGRTGVFVYNKSDGSRHPHPTTKPQPLMRELVSLFSDPGEIVLDPFAGSGSTGVACGMLGRRFLGWELSPEYHAIAMRRLRGEEAKPRPEQPSLFDAIGGAA